MRSQNSAVKFVLISLLLVFSSSLIAETEHEDISITVPVEDSQEPTESEITCSDPDRCLSSRSQSEKPESDSIVCASGDCGSRLR